jgi:hypothetical protein
MDRKPLKIANLFKQVLILMGKNFIMFRRNLVATLVEIICPILFLLILFIMRYFVEKIMYPQQYNMARSYRSLILSPLSTSKQPKQSRNLVLFYPNTSFIQDLVNKTVQSLAEYNFDFDPKSKYKYFIKLYFQFVKIGFDL